MFELVVDDEIKLSLVHESFAKRYVTLAEENHKYLAQWLAWPAFCKTEEDFKGFVKNSLHSYADGKAMHCAIVYKTVIVGNISFNSINHELKIVEIGYWISQEYQGKGIVTRTCQFLIDHAFKKLSMEKVQISAAEGNKASREVCERLGLKLEGIITSKEFIGGKILNHAIYGICRIET